MKKKNTLLIAIAAVFMMAACGKEQTTEKSSEEDQHIEKDAGVSTDNQQNEEADGSDFGNSQDTGITESENKLSQMQEINDVAELNVIDDKYRTCYEVFVYSFCDSDGDGIGDIEGLISKLDYINDGDDSTNTDLGFNEIWLMPVCPSTTYHKYDVTDYMDIDPEYGSLEDFDRLIEECHKRGINVIMDMVMNHSSDQHPWFIEAAEYLRGLEDGEEPDASVCPYVDYYNFTKESQTGYEKLAGTDWYYEARFWSGMPDFNLDNEDVKEEFKDIVAFWTDRGVDGFRMDAVTSYYTDNDTQNIETLKWFVDMAREIDPDVYVVAEGWDNIKTFSKYYESGIDSMFNFDYTGSEGKIAKLARGKYSALNFARSLIDIDELFSSYNENYIDAPFYTNHDMARSAGFYNGPDAMECTKLAGALNLMMSGNAFVYYGEELGMKGSGKDENYRAPMQWGENDEGMCDGPDAMDDIEMTYGSYESQADDPYSIFNYYKEAIRIRNMYPEIARGKVSIMDGLCDDDILAIKKTYTDEDGNESFVYIILNTLDDTAEVDLTGSEGEGCGLGAVLITSEGEVTLDENKLTLPSKAMAVLATD